MIGVYGGTFDPVHFGHLRPALEVQQALSLAAVRFIPCGEPPHRDKPVASAAARLAMVRAAIDGQPGFIADERELAREGPSYMVDTLESLAAEFPAVPLCLILGMDAFASFDKWHQWQRILELAHLVVSHRPGSHHESLRVHETLGTYVRDKCVEEVRALHAQPHGLIYFMAVTQLDISSTRIRQEVERGGEIRYLVPEAVRDMIYQQHVYA